MGLFELLREFWRRKILILALVIGLGCAGLLASFLVSVRYTATVTVTAATDDDMSGDAAGGTQGLISQLGGVAALAGVSLPKGDQGNEAIAVLQSRRLAESYIHDAGLLPVLYADYWDESRHKWTGRYENKPPSLWRASDRFLKDVLAVESDRKTGMIVISVNWTDPVLSASWANDLVRITNATIKARVLTESSQHIDFLNNELGKTTVLPVREMLSSLLERETKRSMLARGRDDYALRVIDPAVPPERATSPQRPLWALAGALLGLALGTSIALAGLAKGSQA